MRFDRAQPYNDLPLLPPAIELETKAVLKQAIAANKALASLKAAGNLIPNQSVLIQAIGLQEAKISSEIENIVTTNDELYRAIGNHEESNIDVQTKEVLHYREVYYVNRPFLKTLQTKI
jgi:Fic family protein